jgi:hypothetical protein
MAWYFKNGDQISGPFEEGVVHSGLKSGFIDPKTTLFRMAENKPWTPIDQTPFKIGGKPPIAPPISAASTNSPIPSPAWGDQPRNLSPLPPPTSKERPNDARLVLGILLPFIFALIGAVVVNILDTSFNGLVYISLLLGCFLSFHLLKKFGAIAIVIGLLALSVWVSNEAPVKLRLPIMLSVVLGVSSYFIVKFKFITMNSLVIAFSTFAISMLISTPVVYYTLSIKDSDAIELGKAGEGHVDRSEPRDSTSSRISDPSAINAISIYWNGIRQSKSYSLNPELFTNLGNFHLQEAITAYEQGPKNYPDARVTILRSRLILGLRAIQFKCGNEEPSISSARIALGENSKNMSSY